MADPTSGAPLSFDADEPLPLTGERTAPDVPEENYWYQRHVAAYRYACELIDGGHVLDAGCGEGYGTAMLAEAGADALGVDLDEAIVRRAADRYAGARFDVANLVDLPYDDASFDAIISLQVIEHLHTPQEFIAQCVRLLRPGGVLMLSTPNRLTFSPEGTRNPFHTFEFSPSELDAVVRRGFGDVRLLGTFHRARIRLLERMIRSSLPERLVAQPAYEWPEWLQHRVVAVTPEDFTIKDRSLDKSLDLIAVART